MLEDNRTITRTNINALINIGPGVGGGRKRRGKKGNPPNTFDDDCRWVRAQFLLDNYFLALEISYRRIIFETAVGISVC